MKYFKPKSVSWWAGAAQITIGLTVAAEPLHNLTAVVASLNNLTGGMTPYMLFSLGTGLIGVRAAISDSTTGDPVPVNQGREEDTGSFSDASPYDYHNHHSIGSVVDDVVRLADEKLAPETQLVAQIVAALIIYGDPGSVPEKVADAYAVVDEITRVAKERIAAQASAEGVE